MENIMLITVLLGSIAVQIFLSSKEKAWQGLIMPVIMFIISFLFPFSIESAGGITALLVLKMIGVWLLANIPTLILLFIYLLLRGKLSRKTGADADESVK